MLQIHRTVGPKGQVVLPKDVRTQFNLHTGSDLVFTIKDNQIIIEPAISPKDWLADFVKTDRPQKKLNAKEIKKIIESQYEDRILH